MVTLLLLVKWKLRSGTGGLLLNPLDTAQLVPQCYLIWSHWERLARGVGVQYHQRADNTTILLLMSNGLQEGAVAVLKHDWGGGSERLDMD